MGKEESCWGLRVGCEEGTTSPKPWAEMKTLRLRAGETNRCPNRATTEGAARPLIPFSSSALQGSYLWRQRPQAFGTRGSCLLRRLSHHLWVQGEELGVGLCEGPALSVPRVEAQTNRGASARPRARHSFQDKVEGKRFEIPRPRPYQEPVALPREGSGDPPGLPEATRAEVEEEEPFQLGQQSRQPTSSSATRARPRPRAARAPT